ncbi:MAG TPA: tyrosine-protein phosphatase [Acidimicrobiales bacterium]|nr:tyrosine-protein phosphatase [Acidimicrobiales bacterium]
MADVDTLSYVTPDRIVPFTGVLNFRDLGGYRTSDGRRTRWGHLYRSDALHDLSEIDLTLFRRLGIATVVDLRNASEVERTGRGLLSSEKVRFINAPVLGETEVSSSREGGPLAPDYLATRYLQYLEVGGPALVQALEEMTDSEKYPLVFNCFFGKDRTGVLSALVLGCVGVSPHEIVRDYSLTASRVPLILDKLREDPLYRETIERTDPLVLAAKGETMSQFLEELDVRYGGARAWAQSAGMDAHKLKCLSDALLE